MKNLAIILFSMLLLVACKSTKNIQKPSQPIENTALRLINKIEKNKQTSPYLTSRIKVELVGMGNKFKCNGSLKMKHNEVILLSLTFLGFEVGRMEFSPNEVLVIDRINKQYVRGSYDQISFLQKAHLNFYTLQALFWNQFFVPGYQNLSDVVATRAYKNLQISQAGDHTLLSLNTEPELNYNFLAQTSTGLLDRVSISDKQNTGGLVWKYDNFVSCNNKPFPKTMNLSIQGLGQNLNMNITLSSPNNYSDWETHTVLKGNYKQRSVEDVIREILKLVN